MRSISAGFQAHLDTGATTLCWCWRITRSDGLRLGFTDHDRDLSFDGTTFEAASGFTASEISESVGLSVDNLEAHGALQSDHLSEADLVAGLYDNAAVEIWRVNWADPEERVLIRAGNLGEVRLSDGAFSAEIRGLAHILNQPKGRVYQSQCDADLGDARCTVNLDDPAYKGSGSVSSVIAANEFTASGLGGFAGGWFARGFLTWDDGPNAGAKSEIKAHTNASGTVRLSLWHTPAQPVAIGHNFTIRAGCDKLFSTCRDKFNNVLNFRGFPHIPGNDFVITYPKRGDPGLDGGSMNT